MLAKKKQVENKFKLENMGVLEKNMDQREQGPQGEIQTSDKKNITHKLHHMCVGKYEQASLKSPRGHGFTGRNKIGGESAFNLRGVYPLQLFLKQLST